MSQNWTGQTGNTAGNVKIQNFLEALRNSQTSVRPESPLGKNPFAEIQAKKEIEKRRIEQFQRQRNQEWNKIFSAKEAQTEKKIDSIREQLKQLSKQVKRLDINLTKAIESPVVEYGAYQESFLDQIRTKIHLFTLNASRTNSWLELYNSRSKKQGYYLGMANSKGSSFTQSNERNIATSVG